MTSQTDEQALEELIERSLVGSSREERSAAASLQIGESSPLYVVQHGYEWGEPTQFDREFTIDREKFWRFLETTQPDELAKLKERPNWERLLLERLDRKVKKDGILACS